MSKSKKGFGRAGLSVLATSTLAIGACVAFVAPANADLAATGGQIGIVDANTATPAADGATLVYPGQSGQALDDIQLVIPNSFKNGDTIDLALFDRSAGPTNGQTNADAAHKLGFSAVPTVTVDPTPYVAATTLGSTAGQSQNNPVADTTGTKATTPPVFTPTLVQSSRANGQAQDIIRLTVNGVQAAGDGTDKYIVNLSGLKVDTGAAATPGELRIVPFAFNGAPQSSGANAVNTFGNTPDNPTLPGDQTVVTSYTVPGYVAPVTFNVAEPSKLQASGVTQTIGDITIAETNNFSLQAGIYKVAVDHNVQVRNGAGSNTDPVTVKLVNAATGETVTSPATVVSGANGSVSFTLSQTDVNAANSGKMSVVISGLELGTAPGATAGPFNYTLTGGSIDDTASHSFLVTADTSKEIPTGYAGNGNDLKGVPSDDTFFNGSNATTSQTILAPPYSVAAQSVSLLNRIGGQDRYDTARKIAESPGSPVNSNDIVIASGENFPDALSANYLASARNTGILLTRKGFVPQATLDALRDLGTVHVFIVGGPSAVSNAVQKTLENTRTYTGGAPTAGGADLQVTRIGGADRYDTNQLVDSYAAANNLGSTPVGLTNFTFGTPAKFTALVATGQDFPDALSAGAATTSGNYPLALTTGSTLSPQAKSTLQNLDIKQVVIVGGTDVVSQAVEDAIKAMGIDVKRVAGANRYSTATAMADLEITPFLATSSTPGGFGFDGNASATGDNQTAVLATGEKYADALAGGPYAGNNGDPVLLTRTDALSPETDTWLTAHAARYNQVQGLGLAQAVSTDALNQANTDVSK